MKRLVASHRQNHYSSSSKSYPQQRNSCNTTKNNNNYKSRNRHLEQHRPFLDSSDDEEHQQQERKPPKSTSKTSSFLKTLNRLNCVSSTFTEELDVPSSGEYRYQTEITKRQFDHQDLLGDLSVPNQENEDQSQPLPFSVRSKASSKRWLKKNIPKLNCVVPTTSSFQFTDLQQQHFHFDANPVVDKQPGVDIPKASVADSREDESMEDAIECCVQDYEQELAVTATENHRIVTVKNSPQKEDLTSRCTETPNEDYHQEIQNKSTLVVPRWHLPDCETSPGPIVVPIKTVRRYRTPTVQNQAKRNMIDAPPPPREIEILNSPTNHDVCAVELSNTTSGSHPRSFHYEGEVGDNDDVYFLSPPRLRASGTITPPPSIEVHMPHPVSMHGTSDAFARAASELANLSPNDIDEVLNQLGMNTTLSSPEISPKVDDVSDLEDEDDDEEEEELAALHRHIDEIPRNETKLPVFKPHPINACSRQTIGDFSHLPIVPKAERAQPNRRVGALDQFVQNELNKSFQYLFNDDAFQAEYNSFSKATHCSEASSTSQTTHSINSMPEHQNQKHHHYRSQSHDAFQTGHYYSLYKSTQRSEATSSTARTVSSSHSASSGLSGLSGSLKVHDLINQFEQQQQQQHQQLH
jgi:hypothetical protein